MIEIVNMTLYSGLNGLVIRIEIDNYCKLAQLQSFFSALTKPNLLSLKLENIKSPMLSPIAINLNSIDRAQKVFSQIGAAEFNWSMSPARWGNIVELIDGLVDNESGHQYLTNEDIDDAIILLSYKEWGSTALDDEGGADGDADDGACGV